ncbi:unnamed protein product [Malassezia sympodialis ATCC 42132]|uniref:uncharacterized protein n=1 Tax=Malassezia sympodialis (strain ATCC 42132) TaxID=1230383 RepID=UPI0002C1E6BF|nr:uncharacterized protein MSY001_2502 [Malassezia sympodialis ATCC 42132]CCU99796.1 unnamed protein product [Malassezia sympodialis ATCC 42132]|eukprot:XP_018741027.1 uncharacterized protein MSY001_2502 [Malassezia sympodialis ATCC 42132]
MVQREPILVEPVIDPADGTYHDVKDQIPVDPEESSDPREPQKAFIKDSYPEYVPVPVLGRNSPEDDLLTLSSGSSEASSVLGTESSIGHESKRSNFFQRLQAKYNASKLAVYGTWTKENLQYIYALIIIFGLPFGICYAIPQTGLIYVFWISSGALFLTTLWLVIEALGSIPHWYYINKLHREAGTDDLCKNIGAIISAYLPNEIDTIEDCIRAVMSVDLPEGTQFRILVAHNGGKPEQVKYLRSIIASLEPPSGVTVQDHNVLSSSSKAHNVNSAIDYFAETSPPEVVVMYDADHQPAKHSVIHALQTLKHRNADLVQGRCVVSRGSTNIAAEFDTIYAVNHAGGAFVRGFGIFGGSNGFWKFELLQRIKMDDTMLTEDVDSGFRALGSGAKIEFDPTVTSHEESPSDLKGLMKQRWNVTARKKVVGAPEKKFDLVDEEVAVPTLAYDENDEPDVTDPQDGDEEEEELPSNVPPTAPPPSYVFASGLDQHSSDATNIQHGTADLDQLERGELKSDMGGHTMTKPMI